MTKLKSIRLGQYRCVLSDTLPYETPIIFSNTGLYKYLVTKNKNTFINQLIDHKKIHFTKPYNYNIKHKPGKERLISIIHPAVQVAIAEFYAKYAKIIIYLCSKSKLSLRAPNEVATKFYTKAPSIPLTNEDTGNDNDETSSTYFINRRFDFLYKFFTSYDFFNLEKKYLKYSTIDIQNCFPSIYTHSIAWAIKGKEFSKRNINANTFESTIDKLAQYSNFSETHGILVGSEFSRIFAEIILQRVDCNIISKLHEEGLVLDKDYSIKRYVDDYFIFYNDTDTNQKVTEVIISELSDYKLFINESKTTLFSRPFITNESIAKIKISDFMKCTFATNEFFFKERIALPNFRQSIISRFKMITKECNVDLNKVCGFSLGKVLQNFFKIVQSIPQNKDFFNGNLLVLIESTIDFAFFIFAMHPDNSSSIRICKLVSIITQIENLFTQQESDAIKYFIYTTFISTIKNFHIKKNEPTVEILNILITFSHCDLLKFFGVSQLLLCFGIINPQEFSLHTTHLGYFSTTALIYLSQKLEPQLQKKLIGDIEYALENFDVLPNFFESTEHTMLFFDITTCPYLKQSARKKFFARHCKSMQIPPSQKSVPDFFNSICAQNWFIEWGSHTDISVILTKKDIKSPY